MQARTRPHRLTVAAAIALALVASACGNDDSNAGAGEEELINEVTLTLTPVGGGAAEQATITDDLAGTVEQDRTLVLQAGTYNGSITLTNSTVEPPIDITQEVIAESDEHRFFYSIIPTTGGLTVTNLDLDNNGVVFGQTFQLVVDEDFAEAGINVILSHFDESPKGDGSEPSNETDVDVVFNTTVAR